MGGTFMFGLGFSEILLICALALIFVGPKKLPEIAKGLGKGYGEFRRYMNEFKTAVDAAAAEEEKPAQSAPTAASKVYEQHYKETLEKESATINNAEVKAEAAQEAKAEPASEEKSKDA